MAEQVAVSVVAANRRRLAAVLLLFAVVFSRALASSVPRGEEPGVGAEFSGRCLYVADGDTLTVEYLGRGERLRLEGIDAPELAQPFGEAARDALARRVLGREVSVQSTGRDRFGRLLGFVFLDGENVNVDLVRNGWAWHFKRYSADERLAAAEIEARERRVNLWSELSPVPPWDHRAEARPRRDFAIDAPFIGNERSGIFHLSSCPNSDCQNCTAGFMTRDDAIAAGFRPAGCCHP